LEEESKKKEINCLDSNFSNLLVMSNNVIEEGIGKENKENITEIDKINNTGFKEALDIEVLKKGKPTLGICLGMQVMASMGTEGGDHKGLGWFDATVIRLHPIDADKRVPNIGWNDVTFNSKVPLFKGLPDKVDFYLVHSFYMKTDTASDIVATYDYDFPVTAAVLKNNIFATQFHPEKSQDYGLKILENFIAWKP
jgi:glutamine amidotransferase